MRLNAVVGVMATMVVAGCGPTGYETSRPAPCPRITILADGADLTRYRPGAVPDLASMTSDARLIGFQARCDYTDRRRSVVAAISAVFEVERGPGATGQRTIDLPWFIAVTDANDSQMIDRREFTTPITFDGNANRVRVQSRPVSFNFPADERLVENHNVRLSFQLTREELDANRRRGPR